MKRLIFLAFLFISQEIFAQHFEMVYRTKTDTTQNKYLGIIPDNITKGFMVIMPGAGTEPAELLNETKLPLVAAQQGYAVFIPKLVPFNMIDREKDNNQLLLESLITEVVIKYNLPKDKFIIGGHSIGGQQALFYAEQSFMGNKSILQPALVFGVDPPLDMKRLYETKTRYLELNPPPKEEHPLNESEFIVQVFNAMYDGSPAQNPKEYERVSAYYRGAANGGNIQYLKNVPVRLYADPDIDWILNNWKTPVEHTNLADITAAIIQLNILGNKNATFVNCLGKGFKPDGTRHVHQFSMLDVNEFLTWAGKMLGKN